MGAASAPSPASRSFTSGICSTALICRFKVSLTGAGILAGPTTPRYELAFIAWNCVPLWTDVGAAPAARRLTVIADAYGGVDPREILRAVPPRIQTMLDGIPVAAAAGDAGMANLMANGEPDRSLRSLTDLVRRLPAIHRALD